ncbi:MULTISPECIES: hypothetical protein [unclassified Marinobacter]|uniref:hypothetical protein n=1 Tax=unclassified Marinobacter TaxID=83889 RepID=UPI0026E3497E|nr:MULTISPECIES: hypothetical protein [unclassified Marinobacter]MDO6441160.1 hypothetical protein [Marinobacter sp. 2_MG-2023]MDO6825415.1 hypothetical protein [Marinobacter sp. 1_MG-2023]
MGLFLKFAILLLCIKHLLDHGRPVTTAFIYAGSFLVLGLLGGLFFGWADYALLALLINFLVDAATGLLFFWFLQRYRDRFFWFYGVIVFVIAVNIGAHFWMSELTWPNFKSEERPATASSSFPAGSPGSPPNLWSHHEVLNVSAAVCAQRGVAALDSLSFSSVVRNGTYVYGNSGANRAAVKCVEMDNGGSFLYLAVAGRDKDSVEKLRNEIAWNM